MIQRLQWLKDIGKCWLLSKHKSSITHHAEGNTMASPTQTVVRKGLPNPLTAEGLLKILKGPNPS